MIKVADVLAELVARRPVFHSEADFQHAFAWAIHRRLPDAQVRLEFPFSPERGQWHLDVWVEQESAALAAELKYKTRGLSVQVHGERFSLKDQSAQDLGRYDFLKDIQRLEQVISDRKDVTGYAILLTNDSAYWKSPRDSRTLDADYRLHEGRVLQGVLSWGQGASAGTVRGREDPVHLRGTYTVHWEDYSRPSAQSYGRFRSLVVAVHRLD